MLFATHVSDLKPLKIISSYRTWPKQKRHGLMGPTDSLELTARQFAPDNGWLETMENIGIRTVFFTQLDC